MKRANPLRLRLMDLTADVSSNRDVACHVVTSHTQSHQNFKCVQAEIDVDAVELCHNMYRLRRKHAQQPRTEPRAINTTSDSEGALSGATSETTTPERRAVC